MPTTRRHNVRHPILAILSVLSLGVGFAPIFIDLAGELTALYRHLVLLNFMAWMFVSYLFYSKRKLLLDLEATVESIGLPLGTGDLDTKIGTFLEEAKRYHRAAYAFRVDPDVSRGDLVGNLRRIAELAYSELHAKAVQLTLSDEASGLSTQSMLIGEPIAATSQELVIDARELIRPPASGSYARTEDLAKFRSNIVKQVVSFAGTNFGTLYVQFRPGYHPSRSDLQVLSLLATQGALMLVDARFTDEILRMRKMSEESVRAKTGFLANLSHEIRGPLGIILNGVELILDSLCGPITEQQRETLTMIRNNGSHLIDLVNDVLDYAKVEAGKVAVKPIEIDVKQLLDDLSSVVRTQAVAKKHTLTVKEVEPTLGIVCDKRHARQMLINFLTNAVKYTPDGGTITVKAERAADNRVKISVSDSGIGIPKDQRSKVFSAFERVDDKYAMQQVGAGLGMPLTRRLAEVNGGSADFDSEEGKGSTFWIILPACEIKEQHADTVLNEKQQSSSKGRGEIVLIVDHEEQTRQMLSRYLTHQGFYVLEAKSGAEVLQYLRNQQIRLAVVENDMPDLTGEEMVSILRSHPKASSIPIILLSARAFVFDIERFLKLGVDRCLSKPVDLSELAQTARRLLDETIDLASASGEPSLPVQ